MCRSSASPSRSLSLRPSNPESVDIATAAAVAAGYSPLSGLLGRATPGAGGGLGGAYAPISFAKTGAAQAPAPGAPSAPPAGVPGSIANAGEYTPDWAGLIQGDPGFKDASAALAANGAAGQSQLNSQIANAYEEFGKNIDLGKLATSLGMSKADLQNAIGPAEQQLAQENTDAGLSTTARLDQANKDGIRQTVADLNKNGMLNSSETGFQLDRQNTGYRQAESDAYSKFLGYLQQYQQGYLQAQQTNAGNLSQAYNSAADRVENNNQGSPGTKATFDHTDEGGKPVYKDANGNLFNADGSAYTAPPLTNTASGADVLGLLPSRASFLGPRVGV